MSSNGSACCICMILFKTTDNNIIKTNCGYMYHKECLAQWTTYCNRAEMYSTSSGEPAKGVHKQLIDALKTNSELLQKLSGMNIKIESQNFQLLRNQEELTNLTLRNNDLVKQKNDLEMQLNDIKEHNDSFNKTIQYLSTQIQLKEQQYVALNQHFCKDKQNLAEMQKENVDLRNNNDLQKTQFSFLENNLKKQIELKANELKTAENKLSKACSWNTENQKTILQQVSKIKSLEKQINTLKTTNEKEKLSLYDQIRAVADQMKVLINPLKIQIEKIENEKLSLNSQIRVQAFQVNDLKTKNEQLEKEKLSLNNHAQYQSSQLIALKNDLKIKNEQLEKQKLSLNNEIRVQAEQITALRNEIEKEKLSLDNQIRVQAEQITALRNEIEKFADKKLHLNNQIRVQAEQITAMRNEIEKFEEEKLSLHNQIRVQVEQLTALKNDMNNKTKFQTKQLNKFQTYWSKKVKAKNEQLNCAQNQLDTLNTKLTKAKTDIEALLKEKIDLNQKIQLQAESLELKENKNNALNKQIVELLIAEEKSNIKVNALKDQLSKKKSQMEKLHNEKFDLNKKIQHQEEKFELEQHKISDTEEFQKEKRTMYDKIKYLKDELIAVNKQLCELRQTNGSLKNNILSIIREPTSEQTISKKRKIAGLDYQCIENVENIEDQMADKITRSLSIFHIAKEILGECYVTFVLGLCRYMSLREITKSDIINVQAYESKYKKGFFKLSIEFQTLRLRNEFAHNFLKLNELTPKIFEKQLKMCDYLDDKNYDIAGYAQEFVKDIIFFNNKVIFRAEFKSECDVNELVARAIESYATKVISMNQSIKESQDK